MKILIIYGSYHHKNTLKIVEAIKGEFNAENLDIININEIENTEKYELENYDLIGFASGIYYGNVHKNILRYLKDLTVPNGKETFIVLTSGANKPKYIDKFSSFLNDKGFKVIGAFQTIAHDSFGPLRLIGGINKGRPSLQDIENAKQFARTLVK